MQRLLFAKLEVWAVLLLLLLGAIGAIGFGVAVLDGTRGAGRFGAISRAAVTISETPDTLKAMIGEDRSMAAFLPDRFKDRPRGWTLKAGAADLEGYVLLSRHDAERGRSVVELVSLRDGETRHTWIPDAEALLADAPRESRFIEITHWDNGHFRAIHPVLLENGDLILKDHQSYLFRLDACARPVWSNFDTLVHHSTEPDGEDGFWLPGLIEPQSVEGVEPGFTEDSLVNIGTDGTLRQEISAVQIFLQNGMEYQLFGAGKYWSDPLHLNDIQPVLSDGPYWKKGDLFLSFRHKSLIMLYRPASGEIIWMRQGPWLAQHDVDILDDHRIGVFDNQAYDKGMGARVHGHNEVVVYDFSTDTISRPLEKVLEAAEVKTLYEGLFSALPGDNYLIEEENAGRLLVLSPEKGVVAEFINTSASGLASRMGWSRYVPQALGDQALAAIAQGDCASGAAAD